jgi:hypothetical protein
VATRTAQFKRYNQNLTESSDSLTKSAIQLRQAYQGGDDLNPEFETGKAAFDRMIAFIKMGVTSYTVGIGNKKVCNEAGELWEKSEAPEGMVRQYLAPEFKDKKRGWQANFWEKPANGGQETINLHLSMYK